MEILEIANDAQKAALKVFEERMPEESKNSEEPLEVRNVILVTNYRGKNFDYSGSIHPDWEKLDATELSKFAEVFYKLGSECAEVGRRKMAEEFRGS